MGGGIYSRKALAYSKHNEISFKMKLLQNKLRLNNNVAHKQFCDYFLKVFLVKLRHKVLSENFHQNKESNETKLMRSNISIE